ncbi:STAS domain-containing protein [Micromonospora sp. NPDC048830]|uniref:STAS domain-containing protein n=1 Tax=Micromonospora sp. NPDC048830 TaxID=3364257 RepID=UPI0037221BD5
MQEGNDRFHVQVVVDDHAVQMRASGEIDIATVGALRSALWAAPSRPLLRLDLSGVRLLSTAGVRALVAAHRRIRARGGVLVLVDPAPTVARVLRVTGLHRVIPIHQGAPVGSLSLVAPGGSLVAPSLACPLGSLVPPAQPSAAPVLACA